MLRISLALALVVSVTFLATAGAASQDEVPFDEYVASLQAFKADMAAFNDSRSSDGTPTVEETLGNLDASSPLYEAEIERLRAITPEPCYAAAHERSSPFTRARWPFSARRSRCFEDAAETVMGMLPFLMMAGEEIAARHPAAVVEDTSTLTGTASDLLYIIPALATCDGADAVRAPATPAPETMADTSNDDVAQDVIAPRCG